MSASEEAIVMATVAARAAAAKLAEDVVVIDVSGQLVITDCFVIASASNERQVNAIVDEVEEKMRVAGYKPARREGAREGRWTLLDFVDIVVHIQHQDERNFYALDRLWRDCPVVAVDLDGDEPLARRAKDAMSRCAKSQDSDREGPPPGHAAPRADRVQRGQPHAGSAGHRPVPTSAGTRPSPRPRCWPSGNRCCIVSSDLRRALDTAVCLGERSGMPVRVDTRLRETHLGDWQGLTHHEVDAVAPGARLAWRDDARWAPHGGESRVDVAARSTPLVAELSPQTELGRWTNPTGPSCWSHTVG